MAAPTLLSAVRDLDRLRQIIAVLVRHGFGEILMRTPLASLVSGNAESKGTLGERARLVIQDLGPSFVKLGQIVSTRPDLFSADFIIELKKLQDRVPAVPYEDIKKQVEGELGLTLEEAFVSFDAMPLASASVGQVHRAKLKGEDGIVRDVVAKVQRPMIRQLIERDVELLYILAQAIERAIPESRLYAPVKMVEEFDRAIMAELDFSLEADHAVRFAKNFEGEANVRFPKIHRQVSGKRVLVMEFFDGKKVYDAVDQAFDPDKITRAMLGIIIKSIFEDGFFHADPHPGNILILGQPDAPVIGLIDLGLVGRLTPQLRDKTVDLLVACIQEDHRGIADALLAIGTPTRKVDRRAFEAEVARLSEKYLNKQLRDIELSALLRDFVDGAQKYGIEIPPDFMMVGKAVATIEGVGKEIAPHFDLYEEMKPYFLRLMAQRYAPERMLPELMRSLSRISGAATDFPEQAQEILEDLRKGRLEIRTRNPEGAMPYDVLGRRLYSGLVVSGLMIGSANLFAANSIWLGGLFFAFGLVWGGGHIVLSAWLTRVRKKVS
jgi:ubiquinone biosynthesis protein